MLLSTPFLSKIHKLAGSPHWESVDFPYLSSVLIWASTLFIWIECWPCLTIHSTCFECPSLTARFNKDSFSPWMIQKSIYEPAALKGASNISGSSIDKNIISRISRTRNLDHIYLPQHQKLYRMAQETFTTQEKSAPLLKKLHPVDGYPDNSSCHENVASS